MRDISIKPLIAAACIAGAAFSSSTAAQPINRSQGENPEVVNVSPSAGMASDERRCAAAVKSLADTDGKDAVAYATYESQTCTQIRESKKFDAQDGITEMIRMMRAEGIDYDARLAGKVAECRDKVDRQMLFPVPEGKTRSSRADLLQLCAANAEVALYAESIEAMNKARDDRHAKEVAEIEAANRRNEREIAEITAFNEAEYQRKVAEDKAAYEAEMADWRRKVALCESGKHEYCAKAE